MKNRSVKILSVLIAVLLAVLSAAGCAQKDDGKIIANDELPDHNPDVSTGKFNEGIVDYIKTTETFYYGAFDAERLGEICSKGEEGVVELLYDDFSEGDVTLGGNAVMRDENSAGIIDGIMYISFSETSETHISSGWTTWAPQVECLGPDYVQAQLSFDGTFYSDGGGQWMSTMVGIFKSNVGSIADNPGDGIYISFNPSSSSITVYGGDSSNWNWPGGNVTVKVGKELISGETHVDIVACENKDIAVYLKGEQVLKISVIDGKMYVFDGNGKQKYKGDIDPDAIEGEYFSFFTHLGGVAMDNIQILGCSKGNKKVETKIEAKALPGYSLGYDITDKKDVVSICYTMWFNAIHGNGTNKIETARNVAELTEAYGFSVEYGFGTKDEQHNDLHAFHYWSKPAQGYYRSTDKEAARNNMTLLYNAGVDFIILDYTYATSPGYDPGTTTWKTYIEGPTEVLLDTIMEMRAEGLGTPYVVFWMGSDNMFPAMKEHFLDVDKWKDCFVYWNGNPFILNWNKSDGAIYEGITVRSMYGLRGEASEGQWSYLEIDNSRTVSYDASGSAEHMCADVATQETYMSLPSAHGRNGGRFWNGQWKNVFDVHPKIVTVTWWNEWCAQLYYVDGVGYIFTDNFNQEYSRDIEPMEGGHGDLYYRWLCEYIRCYKAGLSCPELTE